MIDNDDIQVWIILTAEHNRHEDVALHRGGRNALTISGQQAYHKRAIALGSHQGMIRIQWTSLVFILVDVKTSEQVCRHEV